MAEQYRQIGFFWLVYDQIKGYTKEFDTKDKDIIKDGDYYRLNIKVEDAWEIVRSENKFPKKKYNHYPHGEIVFDGIKYKFRIFGTQKIIGASSYRTRLINHFGLSSFTIFDENISVESSRKDN